MNISALQFGVFVFTFTILVLVDVIRKKGLTMEQIKSFLVFLAWLFLGLVVWGLSLYNFAILTCLGFIVWQLGVVIRLLSETPKRQTKK